MKGYQETEFNKRFDWKIWKQLLSYSGRYRGHLLLLMFLMILVAASDALQPFLSGWMVDNIIIPGDLSKLLPLGMVFGVLVIFQGFGIWFFIEIAGKVETGICYEIRKEGFRRLQELPFSYYDKTPIGWLIARLTSDAKKLGDVIAWGIVDISWGLSMMFFMAVLMMIRDFKLAMTALAVVPVLVVVALWFQKRILGGYRQARKINSRITGSFNEGITGARTSKTLVREEANTKEFADLSASMKYHSIRTALLSSFLMPVVFNLGIIGTALALGRGGSEVLSGTLTYGVLVAFIFATAQFFEPVLEMSRVFAELQYAQASAERVLGLLATVPDIRDKPGLRPWEDYPPVQGQITFENVEFQYEEGAKVLSEFNLHVPQGETIALVGETGSGKSTIVNLACRFYEPQKGRILIDGRDYRDRPLHWLQSRLGYVLQTPHLFSGTVRENIRYGRLEASDAQIEEAAQLVDAHNFIMNMEKGYDTQVGAGGGLLSVGEKQLISFARALLANPAIFVLDEATSSVDTETEERVRQAIHLILQGRTSFIIAHRLSTIREADRILVLSQGRVIEQGSHRELMAQKKHYWTLYTRQFQEEKEHDLLDRL